MKGGGACKCWLLPSLFSGNQKKKTVLYLGGWVLTLRNQLSTWSWYLSFSFSHAFFPPLQVLHGRLTSDCSSLFWNTPWLRRLLPLLCIQTNPLTTPALHPEEFIGVNGRFISLERSTCGLALGWYLRLLASFLHWLKRPPNGNRGSRCLNHCGRTIFSWGPGICSYQAEGAGLPDQSQKIFWPLMSSVIEVTLCMLSHLAGPIDCAPSDFTRKALRELT